MQNIKYCIQDTFQKNSSSLLVPTVPVSWAMVKSLVHIAPAKLLFVKGNQIIFQHWYSVSGVTFYAVTLHMCLLVNAVDKLEAIFIHPCCSCSGTH